MATELTSAKTAIVGILGLQVVLAKDGSAWVAQGIELDYAAAGTSEEDVKKRFEDGLFGTIQQHLNRFGNLANLLIPAQAEVWLDLLKLQPDSLYYSSVSVHRFVPPVSADFTFGSIRYVVPPAEELVPETRLH